MARTILFSSLRRMIFCPPRPTSEYDGVLEVDAVGPVRLADEVSKGEGSVYALCNLSKGAMAAVKR